MNSQSENTSSKIPRWIALVCAIVLLVLGLNWMVTDSADGLQYIKGQLCLVHAFCILIFFKDR